ncbi:MAG: hypothetical protein ACE5FZ_01755 [Nitrospiria bacterium]
MLRYYRVFNADKREGIDATREGEDYIRGGRKKPGIGFLLRSQANL